MTLTLMSSLTPTPEPPKRAQASSRFREPFVDRRVVLTEDDMRMADDLFVAGIADTKAMLLFRKSHKASEKKLTHDTRRLTELWRSGFFTRMDQKLALLKGSLVRLYAFETGKAQLACETRTHYLKLADDEWTRINKEAAPVRKNTIAYLTSRGFPLELVESRIESNTDALLNFYSGQYSQVPHRLLGSHALSILWYGARSRGIPVGNRRADGDLTFTVQIEKDDVKIKPDCFFTLGSTGIALETETGSAGRAKVTNKIRAYLALFKKGMQTIKEAADAPDMTAFCVLFYVGTTAHAKLIESILQDEKDPGTKFFRIVTAADMSLDRTHTGEEVSRDMLTKNAEVEGVPVLTYLKDRIAAPIFRQKTDKGFVGYPMLS